MEVEGWVGEGIRVDSFDEVVAGSGESEAGLHPRRKDERRKRARARLIGIRGAYRRGL